VVADVSFFSYSSSVATGVSLVADSSSVSTAASVDAY